MQNYTQYLDDVFYPEKALVLYASKAKNDYYLEAYDMDDKGRPINARQIREEELLELSKLLDSRMAIQKAFLKPKGLLPANVLHIDPSENGSVIWYTRPMERKLYFSERLGIPNGKAKLPAMLWKAGKNFLTVFALKGRKKPEANSPLYGMPLFNTHLDGGVCMGSVEIEINDSTSLEDFMKLWEHYYFNSYFSHHVGGTGGKTNLLLLWKNLIGEGLPFPEEVLVPSNRTISDLIH